MENDNILVSICTLAYNHEPYIKQCLDGFIMQKTNFKYEVLINDDASTDKTASIIREYAKEYPEIIKPIFQEENQHSQGVAISASFLYPRAQGKYIAKCEGDDYWTDPLKLQKQVDFLEANENYSTVFHPVDWFEQASGNILPGAYGPPFIKEYYDTDDLLEHSNFLPTCSVIFRNREDLLPLPEWYFQCPFGDFPLHVINSLHGKIGMINESMALYRRHQGGLHGGNTEKDNIEKLIVCYHLIGENNGFCEKKSYKIHLYSLHRRLYQLYTDSNQKKKAVFNLKVANEIYSIKRYYLKLFFIYIPIIKKFLEKVIK